MPDGERTWWSIRTGDTFLVPAGVPFQLVNQGSEPAHMAIGAAPGWLPVASAVEGMAAGQGSGPAAGRAGGTAAGKVAGPAGGMAAGEVAGPARGMAADPAAG